MNYQEMSHDTCKHHNHCLCLSWKPIIAGAIAAIGFSFILNLFSVAIGLTAFNTNSEGVENLVLGGLMATALGILVAMFASGYIAGYLGRAYCVHRHLGALYGFLAWCLALLVSIFIAAHVQNYISFYTHFISGTTMSLNSNATPTVNVPAAKVVVSAYIVFCLFFLGAFASAFGGHCGMRHKDHN